MSVHHAVVNTIYSLHAAAYTALCHLILCKRAHDNFVITIARHSIDSRFAASSGAFGLAKETCGQTAPPLVIVHSNQKLMVSTCILRRPLSGKNRMPGRWPFLRFAVSQSSTFSTSAGVSSCLVRLTIADLGCAGGSRPLRHDPARSCLLGSNHLCPLCASRKMPVVYLPGLD